jgi:ribosomal protein S21
MRITRVKHNLDSRLRFRAFSRRVSRARIIATRRARGLPTAHRNAKRATDHSIALAPPH